jgi:primosomal protein N' (replication factor Y)
MMAIRISGKTLPRTAGYAGALGARCREMLATGSPFHTTVHVMGPIEAPLSRIANRHRWQILVKSPDAGLLHRFVHALVFDRRAAPAPADIRVNVDVDPFLMM